MSCSKLRCRNQGSSLMWRVFSFAARSYLLAFSKLEIKLSLSFLAILAIFGSLTHFRGRITEGCIRARPTTEEAERSDIREETSKRFSTPSTITGLIGKINQCQQVPKIIKLAFAFYLLPMNAKFSRILRLQIQPRVYRLELRHCVAHWPL